MTHLLRLSTVMEKQRATRNTAFTRAPSTSARAHLQVQVQVQVVHVVVQVQEVRVLVV